MVSAWTRCIPRALGPQGPLAGGRANVRPSLHPLTAPRDRAGHESTLQLACCWLAGWVPKGPHSFGLRQAKAGGKFRGTWMRVHTHEARAWHSGVWLLCGCGRLRMPPRYSRHPALNATAAFLPWTIGCGGQMLGQAMAHWVVRGAACLSPAVARRLMRGQFRR